MRFFLILFLIILTLFSCGRNLVSSIDNMEVEAIFVNKIPFNNDINWFTVFMDVKLKDSIIKLDVNSIKRLYIIDNNFNKIKINKWEHHHNQIEFFEYVDQIWFYLPKDIDVNNVYFVVY